MKKMIRRIYDWVRSVFLILYSSKYSPFTVFGELWGHTVIQALAFMWSCIFGIIIGNWIIYGVTALTHILVIFGFFVVYILWRQAENFRKLRQEGRIEFTGKR